MNLNPKQLTDAEEEVADVLLYLLQLSDNLNINIIEAAYKKLEVNHKKYPAEACFGSAKKYTELQSLQAALNEASEGAIICTRQLHVLRHSTSFLRLE